MKRRFLILSVLIVLVGAIAANATPLRLDYAVEPINGGAGFNYDFILTLDDNDGTWITGQGWGWIVFGDSAVKPSPLEGFVGDPNDLPVGPYTGFGFTGGSHNGPDLRWILDIWTPASIGDSLRWSGTAPKMVPEEKMLFSTLEKDGPGTVLANFEPANLLKDPPGTVPESATLILVGLGLVGLVGLNRRKFK